VIEHDRTAPTRFDHAVVCGAHSEYFSIDTANEVAVAGVHFKPGGAYPFFGLPQDELRNRHVSLDDLWGAEAADLRDQLLEAADDDERFGVLEGMLCRRLSRDRHPAVSFALAAFERIPHTETIADVTRRVGLSPRRFIDLFSREVGLTPKLFCRVRRFQTVLRQIDRQKGIDWMDVALGCGYFDQAHFIHDFRNFSGLNPSGYLAVKGNHPNHVPLGD
jgi:AraC-like DNA-binding protein